MPNRVNGCRRRGGTEGRLPALPHRTCSRCGKARRPFTRLPARSPSRLHASCSDHRTWVAIVILAKFGAAARRHVRTPPTLLRAPACRRTTISRSRQLCQACCEEFSPGSKLRAGLVVDGFSRNHRRGRAGATLGGGGAYGAYRCATNGGGGDRATRATAAPRIRRDFSLRKGSTLEPQRLPRRRLPAPSATQRSKPDGTALSPRRSTPPANPAPR